MGFFVELRVKKGAMIEIAARINPISYEKPKYKRRFISYYCANTKKKLKNLYFLLESSRFSIFAAQNNLKYGKNI